MVLPSVTIASSALSPSTKTILCSGITIAGKNNNTKKPYANGTTLSEVQTQTYENPNYSITGVELTGASGTLTYADIITLYKLKYDGTNAPLLTITYGRDSYSNTAATLATTTGATSYTNVGSLSPGTLVSNVKAYYDYDTADATEKTFGIRATFNYDDASSSTVAQTLATTTDTSGMFTIINDNPSKTVNTIDIDAKVGKTNDVITVQTVRSINKVSGTSVLSDNTGSTTGISVVMDKFSANLNAVQSVGAYLPSATITFVETT